MSDPSFAQVADAIGLTALRLRYPSLTGAGITAGQVEGTVTQNGNDFETDPGVIGHDPANADQFVTYINGVQSTATFNDGGVGTASGHATTQAQFFYGVGTGVAPGVNHVDNYDADSFATMNLAGALPDQVVNLSFVYDATSNFDNVFDAAALNRNTVFVASAGNGGSPGSPSSAYNVISVDSSIAIDAIGPATDLVPKPDISAPQGVTSRTAAIVSGTAALLIQAGHDGWAGATAQTRADAVDFRTVKALLVNGATKAADYYSNAYAPTASQPLSAIYGSGQVNILNSVNTLYGGERAASGTIAVPIGSTVFTPLIATPGAATAGWNLATLTSTRGHDAIDSYVFAATPGAGMIASVTWAASGANVLDPIGLALVDSVTGALLASSDAGASNVQQVRFTPLTSDALVLQVRLHGARFGGLTDKYAVAFAPLATVACFAAGTLVLTARGEIPVERIVVGELVATASGRLTSVRWIGRTLVRARQPAAIPVRVRAHAIAPGCPHRDLLLSRDHAVAMTDADGTALVPVRHLVNGGSILDDAGVGFPLHYLHIELDRHDLLVVEGLAAESYLDTGNRHLFDGQFGPPPRDHAREDTAALAVWDACGCAPLVRSGPRLAAFRRRLGCAGQWSGVLQESRR